MSELHPDSLLKAAVIGVGHLGQHHARIYGETSGAELLYVVDVDDSRAAEIAERCGCQLETDYRRILDQIQVVNIVTPTETHHEVARDCLNAGVHVLLEKPLTRTLAEADELVELAEKKSLVLQVGHLERFNPAVEAIRDHATQPGFIEVHRLSPFPARSLDVDVVMDVMIHDLDIVMSLAGNELDSIDAVGVSVLTDKPDIANVRLRFKGGCVANLTASRVSVARMRKLRVFQRDIYISADLVSSEVRKYWLDRSDPAANRPAIRTETLQLAGEEPLKREIHAFLSAVRKNEEPVVSGSMAREVLSVAFQILKSMERGTPL